MKEHTMKEAFGTVTVRFLASGGRNRSIDEITAHTKLALEKARFGDGPLRYDDFEIVAATFAGN